jgi:wyosine [tRNA(Phe)-imidazoG37] synthetase (radical SAM superfamily)
MRITTDDHDPARSALAYVYPVASRRARGISLGVNLNPNNACNWRCIYCQVAGLTRGAGPRIDLPLLERELTGMLEAILAGDWLARHAPPGFARLADVAIAGNGEPTTSPDFAEAVDAIARARARAAAPATLATILITNGSMLGSSSVQAGIRALARISGEVWFKLDTATAAGLAEVNGARTTPGRQLERLESAAALAPTWVQTLLFERHGQPPSAAEEQALVDALGGLLARGVKLAGMHLYGLARASRQPEAPELGRLPREHLERFARRVEALGLRVVVSE